MRRDKDLKHLSDYQLNTYVIDCLGCEQENDREILEDIINATPGNCQACIDFNN